VLLLGDGGLREVLALDEPDDVSALSPDGRTLATIPVGTQALRIVELDGAAGKKPRELALPAGFQADFLTFAAGDRLVVTGQIGGTGYEALLVDESGVKPIASGLRWLFNPRVSPDGKRLIVGWRDMTQHTTIWLLEDP
jgi:hypothetical protein